MDSYLFQKKCKEIFIDWYKENVGEELTLEDINVVWSCKTLQNNKILISANRHDHLYVECTYNGDKLEMYFDVYKKQENIAFDLE